MKETSHKWPQIAWSCLCKMSTTGKSIETESRLVVAWGWAKRGAVGIGKESEKWLLIGTRFIGGLTKMLWNYIMVRASQVVPVVKNQPANAGDIRDVSVTGLIPGLGRSPGVGHGNPLQYSCLENPMERGAWQATVYRVTQSWTWLKQLSIHRGCTTLYICLKILNYTL